MMNGKNKALIQMVSVNTANRRQNLTDTILKNGIGGIFTKIVIIYKII